VFCGPVGYRYRSTGTHVAAYHNATLVDKTVHLTQMLGGRKQKRAWIKTTFNNFSASKSDVVL
jgi:hypothetical protein